MPLEAFSESYRLTSRFPSSNLMQCACRVLSSRAEEGEYRETADLYTDFPLQPGDTLKRVRDGAVYRVTGASRVPALPAAPGLFIHRAERVSPLP